MEMTPNNYKKSSVIGRKDVFIQNLDIHNNSTYLCNIR